MNQYYKVGNQFIAKSKVDEAVQILKDVTMHGCELVTLTQDEIIQYGRKFDAIWAYRKKHNCGIAEAKKAIEAMRGEEVQSNVHHRE